jgi:hypothetical protein
MKTLLINNRQIAALCAILTLALIAGATFTPASSVATNSTIAAPDLRSDLSGEVRTLETYSNDLAAYNKQIAQLAKKATVLRTEIDPLERKSNDLKGRISGVQNAIREIIRKLKAANAWNDLDARLVASSTNGRLRTFFQENSFRQELEEAAAGLGSQATDISAPLDSLRRKITGQSFAPARDFAVVRVAYSPAPTVKFVSLGCTIGRIQIKIIHVVGGNMSDQTCDKVSCACNPGNGIGLCTGAACSSTN